MTTEPQFGGRIGRTIADSEPWWPAAPAPSVAPPARRPNVVMVVFDDVGFADIGCYGSDIATPNIDAVAATGLRYTNMHTTAICSASRACLLTGRNHHAVGMGAVANWDTGFPGYRGRVAKSAGNMAEILRSTGYATFAAGKWHLTPLDETSAAGPYHDWPTQRGFDRFHGVFVGGNDWAPDYLVRDNGRVPTPREDGYHFSAGIVDASIEYLRDHLSLHPEKPFFLYLCFHACHSPQHAPRPVVERYRGRFDQGWDVVRAARLQRQIELGIVPASTELAPRNPGVRAWSTLSDDEQLFAARIQEAYAANLTYADEQFGRLLDFLRRNDAYDDTFLAVMSDNGATQDGGDLGSANWHRQQNDLPDPPLAESLAMLDLIGGPQTYPVYAAGWGQASNTPLKRYKSQTHGGGVRAPFLVSWPDGLPPTVDSGVRSQYHHLVDVLPTVLEVTQSAPPASIGGATQLPIDGVSMTNTFDSAHSPTRKRVQYFEMLGNRGIWADGWKGVAFHPRGANFDDDQWELYHLDTDFSELRDLAGEMPDKLDELVTLWWQEADRNQALPLDDRGLERYVVPKPRPVTDRSVFRYLPGVYVPTEAMPNLRSRPYRITAHVESMQPDDRGVLIACGDATVGYALFVHEGHLVHDYNCAGEHFTVRSTTPIPAGARQLAYEFELHGPSSGAGTLRIDGIGVGTITVPKLLTRSLASVGLMIGESPSHAVHPSYVAPFPFNGALADVVIELLDDTSTERC